jgi:hypothetical protein
LIIILHKIKVSSYRQRNLKDEFLFLAPGLSVCLDPENDHQMKAVYDALIGAGKIRASLLTPLEQLGRAYWMSMFG